MFKSDESNGLGGYAQASAIANQGTKFKKENLIGSSPSGRALASTDKKASRKNVF